ncbi:hypothetical protein R6Q59_026036 [Mikania micrantha]
MWPLRLRRHHFHELVKSKKQDIGEMTKKTLDNVWNTTRKVKEAVAGDEEKKYEVPPTDHFVDDLRKRAGGYDRRRNN